MRCHLVYARDQRWAALARRLNDLVEGPAFTVHKAEGRVRAGVLALDDGTKVFVKQIAARSRTRGAVERLRGSRASRAMRGAAMLAAAAIDHPAALAAVETRSAAGAVRSAYIVSEFLEGAQTLSIFALGRHGERRHAMRRRIAITDAVARAVRRMHDAGLYTRDLQETNLMLKGDEGGGFRVYFIDLEDFARAGRVPMRRRLENLVHLDRSIGRFVGRAGRLRFLRDYLGGDADRAGLRRIVERLMRMRAQLDRRAARRVRRRAPALVSELHSALGGP